MVRQVKATSRCSYWGRTMYQAVKTLIARMLRDARDCAGATAVEYAVLLGLIVLICMTAIQAMGNWNAATFAKLTNSIPV
jgi:Flp pilus assembly pilin Flp